MGVVSLHPHCFHDSYLRETPRQVGSSESCELDPLPTWLLKECIDMLAPNITSIVNASIEKSHVLNQAHISTVL